MAENFKVPPVPTTSKPTESSQQAPRVAMAPRPRSGGMQAPQSAPLHRAPSAPQSGIAMRTAQPTRAPQMTQAPRQSAPNPQMRQQRPAGSVPQQVRMPAPNQQTQVRSVSQQPAQRVSQQGQPQQQTQNMPSQMMEGNFAQYYGLPEWILGPKALPILAFCVCIFGFLLGYMIFNKPARPAPRNNGGQQWVVRNTDLSKPYPRCGRVDRGNACILYIMNHTEYDKKAQNFFDEANRLTGVSQHHIELANPTYAKTLIPGGYLVEIKIPSLQ